VRPVDAYWQRKRERGEIPARLSPEAERALGSPRDTARYEPQTHPAMRGLAVGGESRRVIELLLREGPMPTIEIRNRLGLGVDDTTKRMLRLLQAGRIQLVGMEETEWGTTRNVWGVREPTDIVLEAAA
jgi:hypothetical protein